MLSVCCLALAQRCAWRACCGRCALYACALDTLQLTLATKLGGRGASLAASFWVPGFRRFRAPGPIAALAVQDRS